MNKVLGIPVWGNCAYWSIYWAIVLPGVALWALYMTLYVCGRQLLFYFRCLLFYTLGFDLVWHFIRTPALNVPT